MINIDGMQEDAVTNLEPISAEAQMILAELRGLRDEVLSMHQEARATLVAIREMVDELHRVQRSESNIEQELTDVAHRLGDALDGAQPSLSSCTVCGSDVERHAAENGILLICKACGHTAFAERRGNQDRRHGSERRVMGQMVVEDAAEPVPEGIDWTSPEA